MKTRRRRGGMDYTSQFATKGRPLPTDTYQRRMDLYSKQRTEERANQHAALLQMDPSQTPEGMAAIERERARLYTPDKLPFTDSPQLRESDARIRGWAEKVALDNQKVKELSPMYKTRDIDAQVLKDREERLRRFPARRTIGTGKRRKSKRR